MKKWYELADEFEQGLVDLSIKTIKAIHNDSRIPLPIKDQLTRSVTSIGANHAEAINAASKKDFRNKLYIAKKEAAESVYWLKIVKKLSDDPKYEDIESELLITLKTLQKSVSTLNRKLSK